MNIKKTILAPAVLTLGSLSVAAGVAAPVIASTTASAGAVVVAGPSSIIRGG